MVKVHPPVKLKVFVDYITAFLEGRNKALAGIAEKSNENGRGGKRVRNCHHVRRKGGKEQGHCVMHVSGREVSGMQQKKKGVGLSDSVGTLGVDLRTSTKKEQAERRKCDVRFSIAIELFYRIFFEGWECGSC